MAEEMYDEHGRVKTDRELAPPAERKYGKWMAIIAGVLILVPSILVMVISISFLVFGASDITGFGFYAFVLGWWVLFFGIGGMAGAICALMRTRGLLAVTGAVLMMLVMPYFGAPALLLLYFARDEFS